MDPAGVALLDRECRLDEVAPGAYERVCGRTFWGHEALHGGYVAALAMTAMALEVGDDAMPLQHCTLQYLRPYADGPLRVEAAVERRGRTMANATARLTSTGRLCGLALASFGTRRTPAEFDAARMPDVAPVAEGEEPADAPFPVPSFDRVWMYPRISDVDLAGPVRVGGWVRPRTPEVVDHRYLAFLADLWPPAAYHVWPRGAVAQSVDLTYHARASLPREDLPPGSPLLVVLTSRASAGGYVDEDTEIWSEAGELLATTRQMRYVHGDG